MEGLIHVYHGYGQGKTSAATGLALRAAGNGLSVYYLQFLKGQPSGELAPLRQCGIRVERAQSLDLFVSAMTEEQKLTEQRNATRLLRSAFSDASAGLYDMLVLDEVIDAVTLGIIKEELFYRLLSERPQEVELVLTGHSLPERLAPLADYITEFRCVRHPYENGLSARRGIEY